MLGALTDFEFDDDRRRMSFTYRLPGEGWMPEAGRLSVAVTPLAVGGQNNSCAYAQRRTGTYRVMHDASTAAPAGHLDDDPLVQSDTLTAQAQLSDLGLDFSVPTPGGALGLDVFMRGDTQGGLGVLGPRFRHLWEARVVSGAREQAAVLFGDGSGVTWRATPDAERAYTPDEAAERGRLRAFTFEQPPLSGPRESVPADPDADGCVSPLPGWEYTAADGTRYVFARSESRDVPDRTQALPSQVDVARLTSVRDARDNGFDLIYSDTPDGLQLDEVRAMSGSRPTGAALRFEYETLEVSVPGQAADLQLSRLSRVTLRRAQAAPEPLPPPAEPPVCAIAAAAPSSDAWDVLGAVEFDYQNEVLGGLSAWRRGDDGSKESRRFALHWTQSGTGEGAGPVVSTIELPSGEAIAFTPRFVRGTTFRPASAPALGEPQNSVNPFCGWAAAAPGARPECLAGPGRQEVARVDRPDSTWRKYTRPGSNGDSPLPVCQLAPQPSDDGVSTVEVDDAETGLWSEAHDRRGRLRSRVTTSEDVVNLDAVREQGASPQTQAVERRERWTWLGPIDEPAEYCVRGAGPESCLVEAAVCRLGENQSPLCADALARLGDDTDVVVRRRHGLPGEPALLDAPAAAAGGETWSFRQRVGERDGLFAERETRRFGVTRQGPVLREQRVYADSFSALLDRIEGPGDDFTDLSARDPATHLPGAIATPDMTVQRSIDAATGLTLRETLPSGRFTETQYDPWGRPRSQTTPEGGLTEWSRTAGERGGWRIAETRTPRAGAGEATSVVTETDALDRPWRVTIPSGVRGLDETIVKRFEGDDWTEETRTLLSGDPASCELTTRAEAATRYRDERGRISDVVERADGRRVHFEFDARGRVVAEHRSFVDDDAAPIVTRFGYDTLDRRVTTIHEDAYVEVTGHDAGGHVFETVIGGGAAAGLRSQERLDALGRVVSQRPMRGGETSLSWDAQDRLTDVVEPYDRVEHVEYLGPSRRPERRTRTWDHVVVETEVPRWDPDGRPASRARSLLADEAATLSLPVAWAYPSLGDTTHTAGQGGEAVTTTEVDDGLGRVVETTRGDLRERWSYDALDRPRTHRTGDLREETQITDALGRLVFETTRDGLVRVVAHSGESAQTEALCDDGARPTSLHHRATDALGRPRLECGPLPPGVEVAAPPAGERPPGQAAPPSPPPEFGRVVCRSYTWGANPAEARTTLSVVDADGHQTDLRVDASGEVTSATDRARSAAAARELSVVTDADGVTTRVTTDPLGRRTTEIRDALGRPVSVRIENRPELDEEYQYPGVVVSRLTGPRGAPARQETHVVDADGRTHSTRVAYAGETPATWRTRYDSLGRPAVATDPDGIETGWTYDGAGRVASTRTGRDATTVAYWPGTSISTRVLPPIGEAVLLVPDPDTGRLQSRTERGVTTHFEWDTRGRLEVERTGARSEQRWTYAGDFLARRATGGAEAELSYDAAGRVVGLTGPGGYVLRYERDAAGRITAWRMGDRLLRGAEYDALDRLDAEYDAAGNRVEYVYDDESLTLLQDRIWAEATAGLTRVGVTQRDTQGRPTQWVEERVGAPPVFVRHDQDDSARTESYSRGVETASLRRYTPGGRLASTRLRDGPTVTVAERDDHGRPRVVDHGGVPVTISWAPDDQPARVDVGGGLGVTACYTYHPDRRLRVVRWIQGLGAGDRCPEPPADLCAGAVAVYATNAFGDDGKAREVRQCVGNSARTDTLAYDTRGRLTAWRTAASGPLGDDADETAHFRRYDSLDQVTAEDAARWPLGRSDFPDADGALPGRAPLDRTAERSFERIQSDGVVERVRDRVSGQLVELTPDAAGRSTTHTERFRTLDLSRDAQGRPARDAYDAEGRRLGTALQGEALVYDAYGLVEHTRAGATRVFAPPLPGVQLSRRGDGQWEAALLTPTQTPLAVVGPGGASRLQALYSPTGEATESRPANDLSPYPKTWAGYVRYPDRGQFGETAGLYDAGARLYAPTWGQFLEGDPVLPEADVPESWGRYAYGGGDTVGRWDPDGRFAWLPFLAALAYWSANTAVDVTVDAAIAGATGDQDFSYAKSIFVNGFLNAVTAGVGGKVLLLAKGRRGARFVASTAFETSVTTAADAIAAGVNGEDYDFIRGAAGNLFGSVGGRATSDVVQVAGRRLLGGRRPTMRDAPSPRTRHGEDGGAVTSNVVGVDADAPGRHSPERIFEEPVGGGNGGARVERRTVEILPSNIGGTGRSYDKYAGQGVYILRDEDGVVRYVGRGDAPARIGSHTLDPAKLHLEGEILWINNLSKSQARGLEQRLIDHFGGARRHVAGSPLVNLIRSFRPSNRNASKYSAAVTEELWEETLRRIGR
jgi:RHS repeat-associated protein